MLHAGRAMTAAKRGVTRDQQLIISLLCGRIARKTHQEAYLKEGSTEELEARRALARLLRTSLPLGLGVRFVLANLIDTDQDVVNRRFDLKTAARADHRTRLPKKKSQSISGREYRAAKNENQPSRVLSKSLT